MNSSDYTPTKPRGPIAAHFTGPGPNVMLPSCLGSRTAINKREMPQFSFGVRHKSYSTDYSPGPCHNFPSGITRKGNDGTPKYSLYPRSRDMTIFKTPGPGAYSPEKAGRSASHHAPEHTFGSRTKGYTFDKSPAPNNYSIPTTLGGRSCVKPSKPVYSMRGRNTMGRYDEDLQKTPGPGSYDVVDPAIYKHKSPMYSITGRNQLPCDSTRKPGPGQHSPEKVTVNKRKAPKFSFGVPHSQYTTPLIIQSDY